MPFTVQEFFEVFRVYNKGIFPVQVVFYILALLSLYLIKSGRLDVSKVISLILGFFWLWVGLLYHIFYFSGINPAAYGFGILFIIQGCLFLYYGLYKDEIKFGYRTDAYGAMAWLIIIYALAAYPLLGYLSGHHYPKAPEMSAPCPTTIFTFGILLFTSKPFSKWLLIIPFLWSLLGFFAALKLSVPQDYGLFISGIISTGMIIWRDAKKPAAAL